MDIKEEIAKSAISETVKTIIQLTMPLVITLVAANIPAIRDRIWPAIPKWLVMAAVVVFLSISLGLLRLWLGSRRQLKLSEAVREQLRNQLAATPPPKRIKFGLLWTEDIQPFCPVHSDIPLCEYVHQMNVIGYVCPGTEGQHLVPMNDEEGRPLTPKEARERLARESRPQH